VTAEAADADIVARSQAGDEVLAIRGEEPLEPRDLLILVDTSASQARGPGAGVDLKVFTKEF